MLTASRSGPALVTPTTSPPVTTPTLSWTITVASQHMAVSSTHSWMGGRRREGGREEEEEGGGGREGGRRRGRRREEEGEKGKSEGEKEGRGREKHVKPVRFLERDITISAYQGILITTYVSGSYCQGQSSQLDISFRLLFDRTSSVPDCYW